jgi:hypothetical protein
MGENVVQQFAAQNLARSRFRKYAGHLLLHDAVAKLDRIRFFLRMARLHPVLAVGVVGVISDAPALDACPSSVDTHAH